MTGLPPMLGIAGCFLLATAGSIAFAFRGQGRDDALRRRIDAVLAPHRYETVVGATLLRKVVDLRTRDRIGRWFGIRPRTPMPAGLSPWLIVLLLAIPACLVGWAGDFAVGRIAWLDVPIALLFMSRRFFAFVAGKRAGKLRTQMPDALAMVVRSVRVGIPIAEGIRAVGRESPEPTGDLFRRISSDIGIGTAIEDAVHNVTSREDLQEYRFFATALSLQSRTGGGLSETLDNLADVIRKRIAARARGYALAAEARTSALVLACLPVVAIGGLLVVNPSYIETLFTIPLGRKFLMAAVALQFLGIGSMRMLIRRALT